MIVRYRLPLALVLIIAAVLSSRARAQGTFPAPLPGQAQSGDSILGPEKVVPSVPAGPSSPFPETGTSPVFDGGGKISGAEGSGDAARSCSEEFTPLRTEAEYRGKLIKAASDRHAPPDEACRLIRDFERAESRMIAYVEVHMQSCGIPEQVSSQLRNGHKGTEALLKKVCTAADQASNGVGLSPSSVGPSPHSYERMWPPKGSTGDFEPRK